MSAPIAFVSCPKAPAEVETEVEVEVEEEDEVEVVDEVEVDVEVEVEVEVGVEVLEGLVVEAGTDFWNASSEMRSLVQKMNTLAMFTFSEMNYVMDN